MQLTVGSLLMRYFYTPCVSICRYAAVLSLSHRLVAYLLIRNRCVWFTLEVPVMIDVRRKLKRWSKCFRDRADVISDNDRQTDTLD